MAVTTRFDMSFSTLLPCDRANSSASVTAGVMASSHQGRIFSEPSSARRIRSASLIMPTKRPVSSMTESALTLLSASCFTTSDMEACGRVVITFLTMMSEAFMMFPFQVIGDARFDVAGIETIIPKYGRLAKITVALFE